MTSLLWESTIQPSLIYSEDFAWVKRNLSSQVSWDQPAETLAHVQAHTSVGIPAWFPIAFSMRGYNQIVTHQMISKFVVSKETVVLRRWQSENLVLSNELIKSRIPPWKIWKADASSVSPSSERIEELWVVVGFYKGMKWLCHWWKYGEMHLWLN